MLIVSIADARSACAHRGCGCRAAGGTRRLQRQQQVDGDERWHRQQLRRAGHGPARLLPEHHARPGDHRGREGLLPAGPRPEQARDRDLQRRSRGHRRTVRRLDRRGVRRTQPGGQRVPEVERRGHPHRGRLDVRWRGTGGEARDHERRRPQGQEDRDAAARQHAGRRVAGLPEVARASTSTRAAAATSRSSRRPTPTRSRSSPPATSTAPGCPSRSSPGCSRRAAARSS